MRRDWRKALLAEMDRLIGPKLTLEHYCALVWFRERLRRRING